MKEQHQMSLKKVRLAAAVTVSVLALTACAIEGPSNAGGSSTPARAEAQAALDIAYKGIGSTLHDLPPVQVAKGINFYAISCGEQAPSCALNAAAMKEAAETAGWKATIADGKLNPEGFASAIRQAIAGGANVISAVGIGCGVAQAAFKEAVDAGIMVIGGGGVDDCDPQLWASERLWLPQVTPQQQWEQIGGLQADYVWGKLDGDVRAIQLNYTGQAWGEWLASGFESQLAEHGSGKVVETLDISDPESADGSYIQKITTAILSHPEANALIVPNDGWISNGLAAALVSAGVANQLVVVGRAGDAPVLDLIRQGGAGVNATVASAQEWGAWGSIDTAIRVLAKQKPVYIGESQQIVDRDRNLPASGNYQGSTDFRSAFRTAWGVK
jgi:ribose transport system substrate-binding protein